MPATYHRLIRYREESGHYSRFMPWHAAAEHRLDLTFVRNELGKQHPGSTVVVTHHAPHPQSVQPRHQGSALAPAFVSDLSSVIEQHQPHLWIHGHDHGSHDDMVRRTRVLANQAGYPNAHGDRENPWFHPSLVVEVCSGRGGYDLVVCEMPSPETGLDRETISCTRAFDGVFSDLDRITAGCGLQVSEIASVKLQSLAFDFTAEG